MHTTQSAKYSFKNDYSEGAHPRILEALLRSNTLQEPGYGLDKHSTNARNLIRERVGDQSAEVYFLSGGTQVNLTVISSLLKGYQSVISADTGHICTNETGAIEATGFKIHGIKTPEGKLRPEDIGPVLDTHTNIPHQIQPKLVYISNSTELGTHYSKEELYNLYTFCKAKGLILFMDGARLGHGLMATGGTLTLKDIYQYTDVFYLGGTKNGALLGEAVVFSSIELAEGFAFYMKQRGGLLAKGRILGIQFEELLGDNLYFELAQYANAMAQRIGDAFVKKGFRMLVSTRTNQIFPILSCSQIELLEKHYDFYRWQKIDENHYAIRLITSWATPVLVVDEIIEKIHTL